MHNECAQKVNADIMQLLWLAIEFLLHHGTWTTRSGIVYVHLKVLYSVNIILTSCISLQL